MKISVVTYATTRAAPASVPKVPESLGIRAIPGRIVGFYGFRAAREGVAKARLEAAREGRAFHRIEINVEIKDNVSMMRIGLDNIEKTDFVNFSMCKVDLIGDVLNILGVEAESVDEALSKRPERINRLWKHKRYAKIKTFVCDLLDNRGVRRTRIAILRNESVIDHISVVSA